MKTKTKTLWSILLTLALALGVMPAMAYEGAGTQENPWILTGGETVNLTGSNDFYKVESDISISELSIGSVTTEAVIHIEVPQGKTLTIGGDAITQPLKLMCSNSSLYISGAGTVSVKSNSMPIYANGSLYIDGTTVNATGVNEGKRVSVGQTLSLTNGAKLITNGIIREWSCNSNITVTNSSLEGDILDDYWYSTGPYASVTISGSSFKGSISINRGTGIITGSAIQDGTFSNVTIKDQSTVTGSTVTGSTVTGSTVTDSTVTDSTVTDSTVTGSNVTGSTVNNSDINGKHVQSASDYTSIYDSPNEFTVTGLDNLVYNGSERSLSAVSYSGTALTADADYTVSYDPNPAKNAGDYKATVTFTGSYAGTVEKSFSITPAGLTVTANDQAYTYDGHLEDTTYNDPDQIAKKAVISGLQGSDKVTMIRLTGQTKEAGETEIVVTGIAINSGSDNATENYSITKNPGKLTISPKPVTATVTAVDRDYIAGSKAVSLTPGTVNGIVDGDAVSVDVSAAAGEIADANVGKDKAVTVTGVKLGGNDAGNYALSSQPTGVTVTINKAAPDVVSAPTAKTLTYDGSAQALVEAGVVTGGEMVYALGENATTPPADSLYDKTIPKATDAGTWYVWYKVEESDNYKGTEPDKVQVAISPTDKTALNKAIAAAETYYNSIVDNADYADIAATLKTAIEAAEKAKDDNTTEKAVADAITALNGVVDAAKDDVKKTDEKKAAEAKKAADEAAAKKVVDLINALPARSRREEGG